MPPANFVTLDRQGRIWITVSTRVTPRADDYRSSASSGFIAVHENGRTTIKADGLAYTNECAFSADESTMYVNETFARRTSAFDVAESGDLDNKRQVASFGVGTFPDGVALDANGGFWISSIISNRVIRVSKSRSEIFLEDSDPDHLDWVEAAFEDGTLGRPHLDKAVSSRLQNISNIAFGGPDLKTAYLGNLLGDQIASFKSPVAGQQLQHWDVELGSLADYLETA